MNDLMTGILGHRFDESSSPFHLLIYDGNSIDKSQLMFESKKSQRTIICFSYDEGIESIRARLEHRH
jgi:hypothetical protein